MPSLLKSLFTALAMALAFTAPASAQWKPSKPIRIVVPFTPGGGTDLQARRIAVALAEALGVPVVVDNKPGAGTLVGTREVAKAVPDGATLLYTVAGIDVTHIPYPGPAQANQDLYAGRIDMFFDGPTTASASSKSGRTKLIAAATEKRIPSLPDLQTFHEAGLDFGIDGWIAFFGPGGMKPEIVATLHKEITRIVNTPEFRKFIFESGLDYGGMAPADFTAKVRSDHDRWGRVIREAAVKLD